jgi:hypothetical protein
MQKFKSSFDRFVKIFFCLLLFYGATDKTVSVGGQILFIIGAFFFLHHFFHYPHKLDHHKKMMEIYEKHFKTYENIQNLLLDERNTLDRYYSWNIELQELVTEMIQNDASKKEIDIAQSQISQNNMRIKYIQSNISDLEKSTLPVVPEWRFF